MNEPTSNMLKWAAFNDHARKSHPEFARWTHRMQWYYVVPLLILFVPTITVGLVANRTAVGALAVSSSAAVAFVSFLAVFVAKRRGWSRFRELWKEEHGVLESQDLPSSG